MSALPHRKYNVNRDVRVSIPSVAIPYGQRFITLTLANLEQIAYVAPGNVFARVTTIQTHEAGTGTETISWAADDVIKTEVSQEPIIINGSSVIKGNNGAGSAVTSFTAELYINNIFVESVIHDIYIKRIGFSLIRVYRQHKAQLTTSQNDIQLVSLKWPIESMFIGFQPVANTLASNPNSHRDWHRMSKVTDHYSDVASRGVANPKDLTKPHVVASTLANVDRYTYPVYQETVDTLALTAHGIIINQVTSTGFFRDYLTYTYGGACINTPNDEGAYMINFNLYPGSYQPSGHVNTSRAREFYLSYNCLSGQINTANPVNLMLVASALNFIMITDGNATLRFST